MKTKVITEAPAFSLISSDYNGSDIRSISWQELRNAKVGEAFEVDRSSNCGRDIYEETAKVVYKDDEGCAVLFSCIRTSDDPDPRDLETEPKLQWFQFRH